MGGYAGPSPYYGQQGPGWSGPPPGTTSPYPYSPTSDVNQGLRNLSAWTTDQYGRLIDENGQVVDDAAAKAAGYESAAQAAYQGAGGGDPNAGGYTAGQQGEFRGDISNVQGFSQIDPATKAGMLGDPQSAFKYYDASRVQAPIDAASRNVQGELASGGQNITNIEGQYAQQGSAALDPGKLSIDPGYAGTQRATMTGEAQNVRGALGSEEANVRGAIDPNKLTYSDKDVANFADVAGRAVGVQYASQEDQLRRDAAAAGNADPMAVAAANSRLMQQSAADRGDATAQALMQARQLQMGTRQNLANLQTGTEMRMGESATGLEQGMGAQAMQEQQTSEQMRLGAEQNLAAQRLGYAGSAAQLGVGAQENMTAQGVGANETMAGMQYGAAAGQEQLGMSTQQTADQQAAARAAGYQQQQYGQNMGAAQFGYQAGRDIAQQQQGFQNQYRGYLTGEQQFQGQQGAQARQTQAGLYGTATGGLTQQGQTQAFWKNRPPSVLSVLAEGGVVDPEDELIDGPMVDTVGKNGPEAVVPLSRKPKPGLFKQIRHVAGPEGEADVRAKVAKTKAALKGGRYRANAAVPACKGMVKAQGGMVDEGGQDYDPDTEQEQPPISAGMSPMGSPPLPLATSRNPMWKQAMQQGLQQRAKGGGLIKTGISMAMPFLVAALADGGLMHKPTRALMGEAGPELRVPLGRYRPHAMPGGEETVHSYERKTPGPRGPAMKGMSHLRYRGGIPMPMSPRTEIGMRPM